MRVIDSHTEGEPTRLDRRGRPGARERPARRTSSPVRGAVTTTFAPSRSTNRAAPTRMVGALLCEPVDPASAAGLIFFNNAGFLGMCGHGAIGAAVTLAHMGRIAAGVHRFETPVGIVTVELHNRNEATIENVPSYVASTGPENRRRRSRRRYGRCRLGRQLVLPHRRRAVRH